MSARRVVPALLLCGCMFEADLGDLDGGVPLLPDAAAPPDVAIADAEIVYDPCMVPPCPVPSGPNKVTVCGRIHDLETTQLIVGDDTTAIRVRVYDALAFAGGATTSLGEDQPDSCGRFVVPDVVVPFTTFVAVVTDDRADSELDDYVPTAVATSPIAGQPIRLAAFATRRATDAAWSASAELPAPPFGERGVYVAIFLDPTQPPLPPFAGAPVAGVVVAHSGSMTDPDADFYFADLEPAIRRHVDPAQTSTGANGTALFSSGDLMEFTGLGAEPPGCQWPKTLGKAIPGAVFVQERVAECP